MPRGLFFIMLAISIGISADYAYSQEAKLATFQETAQIIIDKGASQSITSSVTLQSSSIQEIKIPAELEQKIRENGSISAVILTNQDQCILGVVNESCILINVKRDPADKNFLEIQNSTTGISEQFIDEINEIFDTKAKLHSTFIHTDDKTGIALETSGIVSGKGTISAAYTMPMEETDSMYEKMSALLIPKSIRDSGGFYDIAKNLSADENAKMTFSIIPSESKSLLQLRLSTDYPQTSSETNEVDPLKFLKTDELKRSDYFSSKFYPLNSILQVVILSPENTRITDLRGDIVPTQIIDGEEIPTDITKPGWVFDPEEGQRIQGKYIFGKETSVSADGLRFSLGGSSIQTEDKGSDESIVIIVITVIAIAAAIFYLKGYRR